MYRPAAGRLWGVERAMGSGSRDSDSAHIASRRLLCFTAQRLAAALLATPRARMARCAGQRAALNAALFWPRRVGCAARQGLHRWQRTVAWEQTRLIGRDLLAATPVLLPALLIVIGTRRHPAAESLHRLQRSYVLTRWVFLRLLGGVYLCAFASLWPQLPGLIGHNGILPASEWLAAVRETTGRERYWQFPTLFWLRADDRALRAVCGAGIAAALLVIVDLLPGPALLLLWLSYLSLVTVSQEFLAYQWDALLLEAGFLAIFWAPWRLRPGLSRASLPSGLLLWLYRWLLFRLMFSSGYVKLASGDRAWRERVALAHHYETQPLPTPIAWYMHQLPRWYHRWETAATLALELIVPFGALGPRPLRLMTALLTTALMAAIQLTGNYGFFNLLTAALCVPLLDDACVTRAMPVAYRERLSAAIARCPASRSARLVHLPLAALILGLSSVSVQLMVARRSSARLSAHWPYPWLSALQQRIRIVAGRLLPFHLVNSYGLFAVMTTTRPEIVIEGSNDGATWRPFVFRYKPGDVRRPPRWNAPHQPRLDWQMWFAALRGPWGPPWFARLMARLLEGAPEVARLLESQPFPDAPPRYVRALLYAYHFTDAATRQTTGAWWRRELLGLYFPPSSLPAERAPRDHAPRAAERDDRSGA